MTEKIIIDGENATMGRLASFAAKQSLLGKEVIIVNADKIIITGNKKFIKESFLIKRSRRGSSQKGPIIRRSPYMILKRAIRGMLSWKEGRGRDAFRRIICHNGVPIEYEKVGKIKAGKEKRNKYVKLEEVSKLI